MEKPKNTSMQEKQKMAIAIGGGGGVVGVLVWGGVVAIGTLVAVAAIKLRNKKLSDNGNHHPQPPPIPSTTDASSKLDLNNHVDDDQEKGLRILLQDGSAPPADYLPSGDGIKDMSPTQIDSTPLNSNKSLISDIDTMLDITGQIEKKPTYSNILLGDNPKPKTSSLLTDYGVNNQENGEKIVEVKEEIETAQKDKVAVEEKLKVMKEVEAIRAPDLPQIEVELPEMQLIAKGGGGGGGEEEEEGDGDDDAGAMKVVIETNQKGQFAVEFELEQIKVMKEDEATGWVGLGENVFADATMNHTRSKHSAVDGYSPNPQKCLAENEEEGEWDEQENGETIVERVEEVVETTQKDQFVVGLHTLGEKAIDSTPLNSNKSLISDIDTMLDITGQIEKKPTYSNILLGDNPKPKTSSLLTDYGVNNQENGEKIVEVKEEIETAQKDKVAVEEKLKVMKEVEAIRAPDLPQIEVELPEMQLIAKGGGGGGGEEEEEGDGDDDAGAMKVVIETNQKGQFAVEFELEQIKVMKEDEATGWVGLGENVFADATMNHTRSKHSAVDGYSPNPQKCLAENEEEGEWDEQENGETIVERVEEVVETTQKDQFVVGLHTLGEKAIDSTPLNSNKSLISDIDTMLDITGQIEKKPTYLNILLGDNPKPKTSSLLTDYGVNNQENREKIVEVKEEIETAQKDKVAVEEKLKAMKEVEAIRAPDLPQIEVELPEMQLIAKGGGGGREEEEEEGDGDDDAGAMKVVIETNQKGQFAVEFELEQIKVMKEDEATGWVGLGENVFADATMNHTRSKHSAVDGYSPNPQKCLAENEEEGEWDEQENGETIVERVEEVVETTQKDQFVVGLHTLGEKAIDSTPLNSNKSLISDIDTMLDITGQIEKKPTYLNILLGDNPKPKTSSLLTDYGVNNQENGEKIVEVKEEIETAQKDKVAVEEKLKAMKEVEAIRAPDLPQIEVELPEMQLIAKGGGGGREEEEEEGDGDDDAGAMKVVIETNQKGQFAVEFELEQIKVMKEDEATGWVGLGENVFADATMNHTRSKHSAVDGYSPNPQKCLAENEEEGEWDEQENGETIVERVEEVVETTQKDQFVVGLHTLGEKAIDSTPLNSNKSLISDIDTMLDITGQIEKKPTYLNILLGDNPKPKTSSLLTDYGVNNQENGEKIVEVKEEIETAQKDKVAVEEKLKAMKEVEAIRAPDLPQIEVELPEMQLIAKGGGGGREEEEEEGDGDDDAGAMKVVIETNQKGQFAVEFELEQIKVMKEDEATGWVGLGENVFADATMNHTRSKHSAVDGYSPNPQKCLAENEEEGEWDEQENGETIVERVEEVVETTQKDQFVVGLHTLGEKAIDSTPLNSNKSLISDIDTMLDITGQIEKKPTYLNILLGDNPKPKTSSLLTDYGVNNQENGEKIVEVKEEIETAQKDKVAVEEKLKAMKEVEAIRAPDLPQIEVELPEMQLIAKGGGGGREEEEEEGDGDDDAGAMKVVIETNQKGQFAVEFELEQIKVMKEDEATGWVGLGENVFADATMNHTRSKHSAVDGYSPNPQKCLAENEEEGEWDEQENGETIVERVEEVVETTQKDQFVVGLHTLGEKAIDSTPLNSNKSLISDIDTMLDITGQIEKKPTYLNILLGDNPKPKTSSLLTDYGVNNQENGEKIVEVKEEIETAQKDKVAVEEKLKAMKEVEAIRAPDLPQIEVELPEMQLIAKGGGGGREEEEEEGDGDDDAGAMKVVIETNQKGQFAVEFELEQIKVMKEDEATGWAGLGENVFADATMNHTKSKHSAVDGYSPNPQKRLAENEEEGEWDEQENGETIVERVEEVVETTQKDQFVVGLHTLGEKAIDSIQIEAEDSPRMEQIGKGGEEDGDNIAEIVEQVTEAAQKNQFAVEMDREVIEIMKEDEKLDSTQIKAEDREHDDGEKDEPAGIEEEDEVDDNEEDEEIAEKGEGSSEVTGDSSMEINAEAEEKEHDDGKIKHNPLVILVQEEEDSDEVDDDNEDEEITEIGEGSSEGTGDSSMESNAGAIWPAESIEELSLEFKEYKINNQKLEETTDRYIVSEESGFCGSYANGCRENEDTARSRITHVKELLRKKINVPMELSGIGIWIWSVAVLLVVVAPLLLSLASIVKLCLIALLLVILSQI